jgi:hypothetical protein
MRKLFCLLALLLVTAAVAGSPLALHAAPLPASPAGAVAPGHAAGTALLCVPPECNGPLCFPPHGGCPFCCHG